MSLIITSEPNRRGGGEQASHNSKEMVGQTFLIPLRRCSYCESIAVLLVGAGDASAGGIARGTAHGSGGSDNVGYCGKTGGGGKSVYPTGVMPRKSRGVNFGRRGDFAISANQNPKL